MRIFLDMDGVIANFRDAAVTLHGLDGTKHLEDWYFYRLFGLEDDEFWAKIDEVGSKFWERLGKYEWTDRLLGYVSGFDFSILTSSGSHHAAAGKIQWLRRELGSDFMDYILTPGNKELVAGGDRNRVLIDDMDSNCARWRLAGGTAILFPQPWNSNREIAKTSPMAPFIYAVDTLQSYIGEGVLS